MSYLASAAIDETLGHLLAGTREQLNVLSGPVSDTTTTAINLADPLRGVQTGAVIAVDQELMYVRDAATSTATVVRGYGGSTAATHSNGAQVWVNPKFSRFRILQALNNELASLSSPQKGLFKTTYVDLTYTTAIRGYDLTGVTSLERLLEVRAQRVGSEKQWDTLGRTQIQLQREADTTQFASGFSLQLLNGDPGRTVRVIYAAPFGALATEATDANSATVGLPSSCNDILALGAAIRLAYPREIPRNTFESQGEPRRAEEVGAGANLNAAAGLVRLYTQRVAEEAGRLARKFPLRRYA